MKRSDELRQQKAAKVTEMRGLVDKASTEKRVLTPEEDQQLTNLRSQIESLESQIQNQDFLEAQEREAAAKTAERRANKAARKTDEQKTKESYSILRHLQLACEQKPLDGAEAEMHQEGIKEARASNLSTKGNVIIPMMVAGTREKRDMTAGTDTQGGHTIQTDIGNLVPILDPTLQVEALGAQVLTGLQGDMKLPKGNSDFSAAWEGENDDNAESSPSFTPLNFAPNRLGGYVDISKQLIYQSSMDVENYVRQRMNFGISRAVDLAAINGSGSGNEPEGILNTTGIGDVAGGTNGAAPTWANIVALETEIANDNADATTMAYLTTPGIRGKLKTTEKASSTAQFIWMGNNQPVNGYRAAVSTQVPSNLTKGSGTNLHAIIFGDFSQLMIGQWGPLDLLVDPYTQGLKSIIRMVINSWWDTLVLHPEAFAAMKDADAS